MKEPILKTTPFALQYLCEADKILNEEFAKRYTYFQFTITRVDDDMCSIVNFLHMNEYMEWFTHDIAARYITGSGTLIECSPSGVVANRYACKMQTPVTALTLPRQSLDSQALFNFTLCLCTTVTNPTPLIKDTAFMAQTHI